MVCIGVEGQRKSREMPSLSSTPPEIISLDPRNAAFLALGWITEVFNYFLERIKKS